jgi:hypothetical protein
MAINSPGCRDSVGNRHEGSSYLQAMLTMVIRKTMVRLALGG